MHTHTLYTHVDYTGQDVLCMYIYMYVIYTHYIPKLVMYIMYHIYHIMWVKQCHKPTIWEW